MKVAGLLFDLDGTLIDTSELIVKSFQHTFRKHYNREMPANEVYAFFGRPLRPAMEFYGPDKVEELITTYRQYNLAEHDKLTKAFAGVFETIQTLANAGTKMAVVTSKTKSTAERGLRLFHLDRYIPLVIGCDQCEHHKPHPEPVQKALQQLGLKAEACIMVGDSPFDLMSARQAGVRTAAVRWTKLPWQQLLDQRPDYILNTMSDLLNICAVEK